jgi:DNA-binding winged helix-turn-helix (wHTH) protein
VPELMIFSRPVAAGARRKSLEGCYVIGEWIVVPEERRIEKSGRVVGMNRELMDALLCLIDAEGEFVSLERLKSRMWPNTFVSDEPAEFYISTLKEALEKDSGSATIIESNPDYGYRLLGEVRRAGPDTAKDNPSASQLPVDPFGLTADVAHYVVHYHANLMNAAENQAQAHLSATMKATGRSDKAAQLEAQKSAAYSCYLSKDPAVLRLANDGYEVFVETTATRILEEYSERLKLNRCPSCARVARTPTARQCRFCGCDWHAG